MRHVRINDVPLIAGNGPAINDETRTRDSGTGITDGQCIGENWPGFQSAWTAMFDGFNVDQYTVPEREGLWCIRRCRRHGRGVIAEDGLARESLFSLPVDGRTFDSSSLYSRCISMFPF